MAGSRVSNERSEPTRGADNPQPASATGLRAAWWWIDRWRKSTAYTDMTAEEQGLYRNLLDEIWLRPDHIIPKDARILAKVSGDPEAWRRSGEKVLQWMQRVPGGWTHETALEVIRQSRQRAEKQKRYRDRQRNRTSNGRRNGPGNTTHKSAGNQPRSPSPSPSPSKSRSDGKHRAAEKREPENEAARAARTEHLVGVMQTATGEVGVRTQDYRHIARSLPEADVYELLSDLKESLTSPDPAQRPGAILFANAKVKAAARGISLFGPATPAVDAGGGA